jgi:hypothetical protein
MGSASEFRLGPPGEPAQTASSVEEFVIWVADRFQAQSGLKGVEALEYAKSTVEVYLEDEKVEFGAPSHGWTRSIANDIADDDMECW